MRILIIEDDSRTASYLRKGLLENGFTVDLADDGDTGLALARGAGYDALVLDVMLPHRDGWSVVRELRTARITTPIVFLTALDTIDDRVRGLELGADDYLVKPFAFSELLARLRSVLRRGPAREADVLRIADLVVDLTRQRATRGKQRLDLTPKEFRILALLARRTSEVISRTVLMEQVWDMNFDADSNVVDVHMRRLRAKVDEPFARPLLHTVRGAGYVLEDRG